MTDEVRLSELDADVAEEVQDNTREQKMRSLLDLRKSNQGRSGADALDEVSNEFELKSTTKSGVSTARDVGLHTLEKWRRRYWVFAKGRNLKKAGFVIDELYFLDPPRLEGWFATLEADFRRDLALLDKVFDQLGQSQISGEERKHLKYLVERGSTKNNPHIPWTYIQANGVLLDPNIEPPAQLQELVKTYPLGKSNSATDESDTNQG